jgi:tRNA nucleotidyltransferase (CCA-adding enzyme)
MTYLEAGIEVLKLIEMNGYEAYFVGGFVRDYILGNSCNDIDIATNALPSQISNIFKITNTGIKYNSVTIEYNGYSFETTTYRIETSYVNNRHPNYMVGKVLADDLKRRDFTINAMAMDKNLNIIDIFGGLDDLKNKVIKTVNDPSKRFNEDALRMLRATYFAAKLGFKIESNTLYAMRKCAHLVQNLTRDRICWELEKLINSPFQQLGIKYLIETNIAPYLADFKNTIYLYAEKELNNISCVDFFALCYYEKLDELNDLHLKNNVKPIIKSAILLAKEKSKNEFDRLDLFECGLDVVLTANNINHILHNQKDCCEFLRKESSKLPIY